MPLKNVRHENKNSNDFKVLERTLGILRLWIGHKNEYIK
jgi:hypothetical protein